MRLIAITSPGLVPGEAFEICRLLDDGFDLVHLRKPGAPYGACSRLLDSIPTSYHSRIVTHEHFSLCSRYGLHGIHLNRRNPSVPGGFCGSVSCSCHSLDEARERKADMDYVFLSPVFDSISKNGYRSAFSYARLRDAADRGVIDEKVVALGGVTFDKIPLLSSLHFGGAAMLGAIWKL